MLSYCQISLQGAPVAPIKPSFYTLQASIQAVQDSHISAVITTLKRTLPGYTIDISVVNELSALSSMRSFVGGVTGELSSLFTSMNSVVSTVFAVVRTPIFGISLFTYCCCAYIIHKTYTVVQSIVSLLPARVGPDIQVRALDYAEIFMEHKDLLKMYARVVRLLNNVGIRKLFTYDADLEEQALAFAHMIDV